MSEQYPGGFITKSPPTPQGNLATSSAYGMWNLSQQAAYQAQGLWPDPANAVDAQFNYVTMLLHGDGTNGAQNNTFLDSSSNNYTITRNGNTTQGSFSPYGSNWSNYFDGVNNTNLNVSAACLALGTGDYTVEGWVNISSLANQFALIDTRTSQTFILYIQTSGVLSFYVGSNVITGGSVSVGTWSHIALTRSSGTARLFLNGTQVGSNYSDSTNWAPTGTSYIGNWYNGTTPANGYISNFRIIAGTALYTTTFTPPTVPLTAVSGTSLLTCQSNRFIDNSASARAITVSGGVSVQRFNPFGTSTAYSTATIGGSGYFDGTGDYLSLTEQSLTGDFTLEGWFYPTLTSGTKQQCLFGGTSTNTQLCIDEYNYGGIGYYNNGARFDLGRFSGAPFFSHNCWNHFAYVRSGSTVTLYINGVSQAAAGGTVSDSGTFPLSAVLGNVSYGLSFLGYANIRVSTTARYSSNFTPATTPWTSDASTKLLLQMTNGAIYDNAMMNDLETVGNVQISTSVKKYGTGSIYLDNASGYNFLAVPYNDTFWIGSGDYTCECWVNLSVYGEIVGAFNLTAPYPGWLMSTNFGTSGKLTVYFGPQTGTYGVDTQTITSSATVSLNAWTHLAFTKQGTTIRLFIDGNLDTTATLSLGGGTVIGKSNQQINIGADCNSTTTPGRKITGYIDDLRITKGYARYTATFTPPTQAFPNIGPN